MSQLILINIVIAGMFCRVRNSIVNQNLQGAKARCTMEMAH